MSIELEPSSEAAGHLHLPPQGHESTESPVRYRQRMARDFPVPPIDWTTHDDHRGPNVDDSVESD